MTYQQEIKAWLEAYKKSHLNGVPDGIFKWKGKNIKYPHILPVQNKNLNILPLYRAEFWKSKYCWIKLHRYFHHLNSSQAMCINFFYPLIKENKLDMILPALNINNDSIDYSSVCFEKDSAFERNSRPTSFDFYFETVSGKKVHFEIKYTEQEFGKAIHDLEHINKYNLIYKNHCTAISQQYSNVESFLDNYQLMRNLIHLADNSYVVFIYPENNKKIKAQAEFAKLNFVKPQYQQYVINLTWEKLLSVADIEIKGPHELIQNLKDFRHKYKIF
jgi:hypothetical protein